jgi:hypothetical protein
MNKFNSLRQIDCSHFLSADDLMICYYICTSSNYKNHEYS